MSTNRSANLSPMATHPAKPEADSDVHHLEPDENQKNKPGTNKQNPLHVARLSQGIWFSGSAACFAQAAPLGVGRGCPLSQGIGSLFSFKGPLGSRSPSLDPGSSFHRLSGLCSLLPTIAVVPQADLVSAGASTHSRVCTLGSGQPGKAPGTYEELPRPKTL